MLDLWEVNPHLALAQSESCDACVVLADQQQRAAARVARQAQSAAPDTLCLRHLAIVLAAGPSAGTSRALTSRLAAALKRASQDMRSFALKREALRGGLIAADEASAYSDALRLIAGQSVLARPWEPPQ